MQPELTLRAWGALIILYAIGASVVDLVGHVRWLAARRRVFRRFLSEWRKVEIKHCEQEEKKDGENPSA